MNFYVGNVFETFNQSNNNVMKHIIIHVDSYSLALQILYFESSKCFVASWNGCL